MGIRTNRFYYGWVIVAISSFTLFLAMGTRFTFGVYYIAILGAYGWGRAETAGAFSLAMVFHALSAPVSGILVDRFGPRRLFPAAAVFLFLGLLAASRISAIWHLYLFFGVVMAIGINTLSFSPVMSIIPKWFVKRRGLANGLVASGVGIGSFALVPLNGLMIDHLGWRSAFLVMAGIILFLLVPATAVLYHRSPSDIGLYPDGMIPEDQEQRAVPHQRDVPSSIQFDSWSFNDAVRRTGFWFLVLAVLCDAFVSNMILVHQAAYIVDLGYSRILAASLVGLVGLLRSLGGVLCGFLSDHIGRRSGYSLGGLLAFVGILFLLFSSHVLSPWMLYIFVILFGLGDGSRSTMIASITGDLFPGNALGRIMSIQSVGFGIGGAIGAYLGGYFYDRTGAYTLPFLFLLGAVIIAVLCIWTATSNRLRDLQDAERIPQGEP